MTRGEGGYAEPERGARLFVGIRFPVDLRARIEQETESLRRIEGVRWASIEQLHLTLRFLGQTPVDRIGEIAAVLSTALIRVPSHVVELGRAGAFPSRGRARVLWLGVSSTPSLLRVHETVESALAGLGIPPEARPFRPHVTLGRVRRGAAPIGLARAIQEIELHASLAVRVVSLMESRLSPSGARHIEIGSAPLAPER